MFYLPSKFHENRVNTFGFMEVGGEGQELQKSPGGIGLRVKHQLQYFAVLVGSKLNRPFVKGK